MEKQEYPQYEDEITLKELILKTQEYAKEVLNNWLIVFLFCIPIVGFFVYKSFTHLPEYTAEVRFLVEGQGGSNLGAIGGLLSGIGFRTGGGGKTNPYKILEVAKSKGIVSEVMFIKSHSSEDYLANNIIEEYNLKDKWGESNEEMLNFEFQNGEISQFKKNERKAFLSIYQKIIGSSKNRDNALVKISLNEDTGIFNIVSTSISESLSLDLANNMYEILKEFFEVQIFQDQIQSRDVLKAKADSINYEIDSKLRSIASFEDSSRGLISRTSEISKEKMMVEVDALSNAYVELRKSLTLAEYELQNLKPLFLPIDVPYSPLRPSQSSFIISILKGFILGMMLSITVILGLKLYRDTMS